MNFDSKKTDRLGRINIDPDLLKEIFEKINGEFIGKKIELAKMFGLDRGMVERLILGHTWKRLER